MLKKRTNKKVLPKRRTRNISHRILFLVLFSFLITLMGVRAVSNINQCQSLSANTYYNLTEDVYASNNSHCFTTSGTNITLDCSSNTIHGNESNDANNKWGIHITENDVKVYNCVFENWTQATNGPTFASAQNIIWENITVKSGSGSIKFHNSANITLNNITFEGASEEIFLYGTTDNVTITDLYGQLDAESTVGNITITNWEATGVDIDLDNSYSSITNLYSHHNSIELSLYSGTTKITNSRIFHNTGRTYFEIDKNIYIDNLTVFNNTGSTFSFGANSPNTLEITNSNFTNEARFYIFQSAGSGVINNAFIQNNTFENHASSLDIYFLNNSLIDNNDITRVNFYTPSANLTNFSNNFLTNASFYSGSNNYNSFDIRIFGNTIVNKSSGHSLDASYTNRFWVYNNTLLDNDYQISVEESLNGYVYDNLCNETIDGSVSHGIMLNSNNFNVTVYNNLVSGSAYGFLFEWGTHNSTMYNNTMLGGIFYSLHDTHDNVAYDNYIEGNLILHDNTTREHFYNNNITGNLIFRWDLTLGPEGTGAFNNIIQDTHVQGNLILQDNSTDNSLINVSWGGTETVDSVNISSYLRKFYLDTSSNINNTNITITNSTGGSIYSNLINGSAAQQTLLSYINEGGTKTYYSNYTISASASGYVSNTTEINLTDNNNLIFNLVGVTQETVEETTASSSGGGYPTYKPTNEQLTEGFEKILKKNWKISFKIENVSHQLKIDKIENITVTITVSTNPITFDITINETKKLDLNTDNYYDLEVFLKDIRRDYADLVIKEIYEKITVEDEKKTEEKQDKRKKEFDEEQNKVKIYIILSVVLVVLAILITIFWEIRYPKKKKRRKR